MLDQIVCRLLNTISVCLILVQINEYIYIYIYYQYMIYHLRWGYVLKIRVYRAFTNHINILAVYTIYIVVNL